MARSQDWLIIPLPQMKYKEGGVGSLATSFQIQESFLAIPVIVIQYSLNPTLHGRLKLSLPRVALINI